MNADVAAIVRDRGSSPLLERVSVAAPRAGEVLVRVLATGVCHTDLVAIDGGVGYPFPAVFGHEGSGIVEAVGEGVSRVRPGDRVVLSFASCGACTTCREGHPAYCERFAALNHRPESDAIVVAATGEPVSTAFMRQSSWATRVIAHESNTVPVAGDVPAVVAAPLGCGVLTGAGTVLNVLAPAPGSGILVLGSGAVGLSAVMAAKASGCRDIIAVDPLPARRRLALDVGATVAIPPELVAETIATVGAVRHVLDTVGTQESTDAAIAALAPHGTIATVALRPGSNRISVPQGRLLWGRTIRGVIEGDAVVERDIPRLVDLWRAGALPVEKIVTVYPLDAIGQAIDDTRAGRTVKAVLLTPDGGEEAPGAASPLALLDQLRERRFGDDDLARLWRTLPPVEPAQLRGRWRGWAVTRGHRAERMLERSGWYGKHFHTDDDVDPIIVRTRDGDLVADESFSRGGASLWRVERDGVLTAAMVYDALPIIDSFTRLSEDAVFGVMGGKGTADAGRDFYFVLERDADGDPSP
ncbi:alcohol dehydrogenase catalytic domain-containing protein [Microbacterium hominis]|uniref:Alcohol dehydrogenase catalytic domain-containing protein n=1 Tax=Microbacterium hominis TaxID=162426 RepID=A0A7D4Q9R5_9MICO|nr:alcohol dehydrogenase catalytic domain-containing protein [Microbacterium hominis]QKJ20719.1 alcohol dehydrogenase catalytic domain-containing protein [Microbacterium hominis]